MRMKLCIMVHSTFLLPHQPAVKQSQARAGHHQHQRGADQHPGVVAGALGGFHRGFEVGDPGLSGRRHSLCQSKGGQE